VLCFLGRAERALPYACRVASQLTSALGLYGYAGRKPREHSGRQVRIRGDVILRWANARGEPNPAPVERSPSDWDLEQKLVVFKLSCEQ
jgi:hypothetical protein